MLIHAGNSLVPLLIAYTPRGGLKCPIKILPMVYKDSNNLCLQILCVLCVMLAVDKGTLNNDMSITIQ